MEDSLRKYTISLIVISERGKVNMEKPSFSELIEDMYHQIQEAETNAEKLPKNKQTKTTTTKNKDKENFKAVRKKSINFKRKMVSITLNFSIEPKEIENITIKL